MKRSEKESPVVESTAKKQRCDKKRVATQPGEKSVPLDPKTEEFCKKFKQPEDAIQYLLANAGMSVSDFFKNKWEKEHVVMSAASANEDLKCIFSKEWFSKMAKESEAPKARNVFFVDRDFCIERYHNDKTTDMELKDDKLTEKVLKQALDDKFSLQVKQPQRFQPGLHALMEPLESYFGSLVTANGYITPANEQVLGPHYVDEESFIVQTEGTQTWTLYSPTMKYCVTFGQLERKETGDAVATVTLKAGDVLYVPRGMGQEAKAGDALSSHITFATYTKQCMYTVISETMTEIIEQFTPKCEELRRGLPIGFLPTCRGFGKKDLADALTKLANCIRTDTAPLPTPEDSVARFMFGRLPPFGGDSSADNSDIPSEESKVQLRNKNHVAFYIRTGQDAGMDEAAELDEEAEANVMKEEDLEPKKELAVLCSMHNSVDIHGMVEGEMVTDLHDALTMSADYEVFMKKLHDADGPLKVTDFKGTDSKGKDLHGLMFVRGLFNIGALEVVA